jgi:tetratricopeptide (TPR) repeat protein
MGRHARIAGQGGWEERGSPRETHHGRWRVEWAGYGCRRDWPIILIRLMESTSRPSEADGLRSAVPTTMMRCRLAEPKMEKKTTYSVMVSGTYTELIKHRQAVMDAMLGQRLLPVAMDYDAALPDQDLIDASLAKVDDAHAYVGLIGYRYGQRPECPTRNPKRLSLTELEFHRAVARGIPICMFIMHDEHLVPKGAVDEERGAKRKLKPFVRLAKNDRIYAEFKSVDDLRGKAIQSLVKLREVLDERGVSISADAEDATYNAPKARGFRASPVTSEDDLRLAYENTAQSRRPCQGATTSDLDSDLVNSFATKERPQLLEEGIQGEQLSASLGLLAAIPSVGRLRPHNAAILCFCRNPERHLPQARASFVVGEHQDEGFILEKVMGPLQRQIIRLIELTVHELRTYVSFDREGRRVETNEIPLDVLREAISNAIAHRDYQAKGTVQVRVTKTFVEVISPGSFPQGYSCDSFMKTEAVSSPIDEAIAYYLNIQLNFEGIGRGFSVFRNFIEQNGEQAIRCEFAPGPTVKVRIQRPQKSGTIKEVHSEQVGAVSNIPIRVPMHFMGRDDALAAIETAFKRNEGRVAITVLHGLRGVGKTTLAAAYAERHRGGYRATWWIRAQEESSLRADLVALSIRLGWVGADGKEEPAVKAVMERLRDEGEGILLIFDNAVDADSLRPYLPRGGAARVLVTSNAHTWRGVAVPVEIRLWPKEIGADYLIARTGRTAERAAAEALSEVFGGLPLAHEQAAAYCERLEVSLAEYRRRFEVAPARLLDDARYAPSEYHDGLTVAKSFALAIEEAAKLHPAAEPLIVRAALLAPEPIPLFLFSDAREEFGEPLATALAGDGLDQAVAALRTFALVDLEAIVDKRDVSVTTNAIRLNRLVREVAAARCEDEWRGQLQRALVAALVAVYPDDGYGNPASWPRCAALTPHLLAICGTEIADAIAYTESADLLDRAGGYFHGQGAYAAARSLVERALAIRESVLGPEHPDTASSLNALVALLRAQGDLASARGLQERALAISEKVFGSEHRITALSLNNLARVLQDQGDLAGARPLIERAVVIRERALGPEHPDTANSISNLASLFQAQGDLAAARSLYERALAIREKVLGSEHRDTAASLNNLAGLLYAQGDFAGARPLLERALAIYEKMLGPEHPDAAWNLSNLAVLLKAQHDFAGARHLLGRALAIRTKVLGAEHPLTAQSRNNLAKLGNEGGKRSPKQ